MAVPVVETHSGSTYAVEGDQTFTITKPTDTAEGDLLVAFLTKDTSDDYDWSGVPADWTYEIALFDSSSAITMAVFWKEAGDSEPADYTWTFNSTTGTVFGGGILRISGADVDTPFHKTGTAVGASESADCPDVETTIDDCLILRLFTADDDDYSDNSTPAAHTVLWADFTQDGNDISSGAAHKDLASKGAAGAASFTGFTAAEDWCAVTIAIAPGEAAPPAEGNPVVLIMQQSDQFNGGAMR